MDLPLRVLQPFLGARILKTGVAVFLTLALLHRLGSAYATFGAVAAVLAVQPSITQARNAFQQQLVGNAVAGAVATLLGLWLPVNPLTMALGAVLTLGILVRFRLSEAAGLAVVVVLFVMDRPAHDFLLYTLGRMGTIVVGMTVGFLVNRLIRPPDALRRARSELAEAHRHLDRSLNRLLLSLSHPEDDPVEQVLADADIARRHLSAARTLVDFGAAEGRQEEAGMLRQVHDALEGFLPAAADIHRAVREAGGMAHGPEREAFTAAVKALQAYARAVLEGLLQGTAIDPDAARRCDSALAAFAGSVAHLIDRRDRREFGLQLHLILAEMRHMVWRLSGLARLARTGGRQAP